MHARFPSEIVAFRDDAAAAATCAMTAPERVR
jgi:hypothetical protein